MGSVAVAPILFPGSCRSLAVQDAASAVPISLNRHLNKHEFGRRCRNSNNSNAISETVSYPKYDRLLPCPTHKSPPRIEHLVVSQGGPVLQYISKALDLPHL